MPETSKSEIDRTIRKFQHYLMRWRLDPVAYVMEACNCIPTDKQAVMLRALARNRFVSVRSGHGIGKSRLLAWVVNWFLDVMWEPGVAVKVPVTGPSSGGLSDIIWSEIGIVRSEKIEWLQNKFVQNQEHIRCVECPDVIFASLRTARKENPNALSGFHGKTLYVVDEAATVDEAIFEVMRGAMTDAVCYGIMTGNPTRTTGYFHNSYTKKRGMWTSFKVSSLDTMQDQEYTYEVATTHGEIKTVTVKGRVSPNYPTSMAADFGSSSNTYKVRVLGEEASGSEDVVIPGEYLAMAVRAEPRTRHARRVMGVDVARTGNDASALCVRHGRNIERLREWHGADTIETVSRVEMMFNEFRDAKTPVDLIGVDVIGVGAGVFDLLRHHGFPVRAVDVSWASPTEGPKATRCHRLRDWLWWQSRLFFMDRRACIMRDADNPDMWDRLVEELQTPTYDAKTGVVRVEKKSELKERGFRSPNLADALNLTFFLDRSRSPSDSEAERKLRGKRKIHRRSFKTV
jgi:phage terminase large subunit